LGNFILRIVLAVDFSEIAELSRLCSVCYQNPRALKDTYKSNVVLTAPKNGYAHFILFNDAQKVSPTIKYVPCNQKRTYVLSDIFQRQIRSALPHDDPQSQRLVISNAWRTGTHLRKALQSTEEPDMRVFHLIDESAKSISAFAAKNLKRDYRTTITGHAVLPKYYQEKIYYIPRNYLSLV
jgi:hypothetical protein